MRCESVCSGRCGPGEKALFELPPPSPITVLPVRAQMGRRAHSVMRLNVVRKVSDKC